MKTFGVLQLTMAWFGLIYALFGDRIGIIQAPTPGASFTYAMVSGLIGIMGAVFFVGAEIAAGLRDQRAPAERLSRGAEDLSPSMR